jgi:dipeptidyl aminopeptidase/acylaminoacyl peptidase
VVEPRYLSAPVEIEFATEGGLTAFGYFYPPKNPEFVAPGGELPPLIVVSHGGPTSATSTSLSLSIQFWTSRGFAILDVNYSGSTGYGRQYRRRLNGQWGIVDVDDCVNGALALVREGKVDPQRLAIRGGSAGGYTTLAALTVRNVFKAGASYSGICDLAALEADTHKFEAGYSHSLIGPYPEQRALYRERSPLFHADRLSCPVIFFQGLEDKVVPPNQTQLMIDAMGQKGLPVAAIFFEGEQHGFRKAETIKRTLEAELSFYGQIFRFTPAGPIEPVAIENLYTEQRA